MSKYKSVLHEMTQTTPTVLWNDSATLSELEYSIDNGAVGATCNPTIVLDAIKQETKLWNPRIAELAKENPTATEDEIGWLLVEDISKTRAPLLKHIFDAQNGRNGRLSVQTSPLFFRDPKRLAEQAIKFSNLAPNIIVKIPVTKAGVVAMEEAVYAGVNINATACFTLPQCVAVAEAIERGMKRREAEGLDVSTMGHVCTIMVGRVDDWLKLTADKKLMAPVNPASLEWAGVAIFKKTYKLYKEKGYRVRLLSAAMRNHLHWSELIGGDVVISPPYKWQVRYNNSEVTCENRIETPVAADILHDLQKFEDFNRGYNEGGLTPDEFDNYGPTARTVRGFLDSAQELGRIVRDIILPNPDTKL